MSIIKSKVFRLLKRESLVIQDDFIDLKLLGDNEILCETIYSAISPGTETAAYIGKEPLRAGKIFPRLLGYCNVARVLKKGSNVKDLIEGDIVLTFQSHRSHFIQNINLFYIKITDKDYKKYTPAYLFHLGYHALITAKAFQGHNVAILGAGVLGFTSAIMSEISGCKTFVLSNQEQAIENLESIGVSVYKKESNSIKSIYDKSNSIGPDILINTSNSWYDWNLVLKLINKGGTIVNIGFPGRGESFPNFNPLEAKYLYTKSLTIKALSYLNEKNVDPIEERFNLKRNMEYIFNLIRENKISTKKIISEEIEYQELSSQYQKYIAKNNYLLSTLLKWKN